MTETIFKQEEISILSSVDKAKASSNNSQTIGRNGEKPLIDFLNNYLPPTLKAVSGHFITINSKKSPQIDILIIDSRYPLLGYNSDGTVLVMAHSVLRIIEIKTNLTSRDLKKTAENFSKTRQLTKNIWIGDDYDFYKPIFEIIAFRISVKPKTIVNAFFEYCEPEENHFQLTVLRIEPNSEYGMQVYFHPTSTWKDWTEALNEINKDSIRGQYLFGLTKHRTPLSDFYFSIIQDSYYTLNERNYQFDDIGNHFNNYIKWSTEKWK